MGVRSISLLVLAGTIMAPPLWGDNEVDLSGYRVGTLNDDAVRESSGLACPRDANGFFWTHNDGGNGAWLYRLDREGTVIEQLEVNGSENVDWEDLALLQRGTQSRLVIADIGDNFGRRDDVQLLITDASDVSRSGSVDVIQTISFSYPDGPRDSEAIAVDDEAATVWIVAKRTIPAELYILDLASLPEGETVTAEFVGTLNSLPQPSRQDIALAPIKQDWFWQPTALDFSPDGRLAAVLTYEAIYLYERQAGESWQQAFEAAPSRFALGEGWAAEALCLTSEAVFWTTEGKQPPLFRIPLSDPAWAAPN